MYSQLDNDWREAAGILRSLSRKLTGLKWLDLSGCGQWWDALMWRQLHGQPLGTTPLSAGLSEGNTPDEYDPYSESQLDTLMGPRPDWNGAWRGICTIVLKIGWTPVKPPGVDEETGEPGTENFSGSLVRKKAAWAREQRTFDELRQRQRDVMAGLRAVRREGGGGWIDIEV